METGTEGQPPLSGWPLAITLSVFALAVAACCVGVTWIVGTT